MLKVEIIQNTQIGHQQNVKLLCIVKDINIDNKEKGQPQHEK